MKRFTKLFSFILAVVLIISIFPAAATNAEEKKYKLSLTGEYDLGDEEKVIYNYSKMLKNIKLEKVEGKNQWNLTMHAGTTVVLPYLSNAEVDEVEIATSSEYVNARALYSEIGGWIKVTAREKNGQNKTLTNKVLTCKAYNESGKSLSTLKIVVKILPYNAKMERTKLVTAEELYKIGYLRNNYSDFAWETVIGKYKEVLLEDSDSPLYLLAKHIVLLDAYGHQVPQYLYDKFETEDVEELDSILYDEEPSDVWGYDYDLIRAAVSATNEYRRTWQKDYTAVQELLDSLDLDRYEQDWEKVLEVQKWVKSNIKYEVSNEIAPYKTLQRGTGDCDCYAKLMEVACRLLDIPCYVVDDPKGWSGNGHAWNIVLIDGMWCTMDLTGDVGFGVVDCRNFKNEPSLAAYEELQLVFGGKAYLFGDDLPDEVERLVHLYQFRIGEHRKLLLENYKEWLERKYDPTIHKDNTFKYWFREYRLTNKWGIDNHPRYNEWLQNEYDPKVHEGDPLEYWYIHVSDTSCYDCSFIVEYFPEELDAMEAEAAQWRE